MTADFSFEPAAYLLGESSRPSPITIYGLSGGHDRWLRIDFDTGKPQSTWFEEIFSYVQTMPVTPFLD